MSINVLGLDLGKLHDYSAIAGIEATPTCYDQEYLYQDPEYHVMATGHETIEGLPVSFAVRYLERFPLGTEYPDVIEGVVDRLRRILGGGALLAVDASGVGVGLVDAMARRGLNFVAVTITGGERTSGRGGHFRVPKQDLMTLLTLALENRTLKFPRKLAKTTDLIEEFLAMEFKATSAGNLTYGSWRTGSHDDMVLALALAMWLAEKEYGALAQLQLAALEEADLENEFEASIHIEAP